MAQDIRFPRINSVMLSGHLTREVELRYTPKGSPVARMGLAFNTAYKNQEGNWIEEPHFIDVKAFGRQAEACATKLHKGSPIIVEGSFNTFVLTNKDNQQRRFTDIIANRIHFLEKQSYSSEENPAANSDSDEEFENNATSDLTDDDVPF